MILGRAQSNLTRAKAGAGGGGMTLEGDDAERAQEIVDEGPGGEVVQSRSRNSRSATAEEGAGIDSGGAARSSDGVECATALLTRSRMSLGEGSPSRLSNLSIAVLIGDEIMYSRQVGRTPAQPQHEL
jgi:hypothetical protein